MKLGRNLLCLLLTLALVLSLGGGALASASGEASGESSSESSDIRAWPTFRSAVFTAEKGDEQATFLCYGVLNTEGDTIPFADDKVVVTLYDAESGGSILERTEAVYDRAEGGWVLTVALPAENSVFWASVNGGMTAPVYIVVDEAETAKTLYNASIAAGGESDGELELSEYAPVMGVGSSDDGLYYDAYLDADIVRPYVGTNSTLFTAADFADLDGASAYEKAAVDWWLGSGFTNGADALGVFGAARDAFYTFELTLFVYRYFGVYDNAYGAPMEGFTIGSEPYFVSIMNTNGTGILDDIAAVEPGVSIDCSAAMTYRDVLATLYNALESGYAKLSDAGAAAAAAIAGAEGAKAKAAAMAGLLGLEIADDGDTVGKLDAIGVFYELARRNYITPMTYPDEAYARRTSLDVEGAENAENGNDKTAAFDVYRSIDADAVLEGDDAVIDVDGNFNALVVTSGAKVSIVDPFLRTTSSNSDYGFGGGAVLMARDAGTVVSLLGTDGSINVDVETGSSAGGLMPLCSATVFCKNVHVYSPGTHSSNLTYNGVLWYEDSTILGAGRIFSTDYWGGYLVFDGTVSFKGEGSGGSVLDETSLVYYKNSYIHGSSTSEINGCGTVYYENCIADFDAFYEFHNNTSYWTDTGSLYAVNSVLNFGDSFYWVAKADKSVVTLADSAVTLGDDSQYAIALGYTKGGRDFMTREAIEPGAETESYVVKSLTGAAAEQVNGYSILRLYGDSSLTGGAQQLYIGARYALSIETDAAFDASGNVVSFTLDRTQSGNSGVLYVGGAAVEGAGVHDFGGVVITVVE